MAKTARSSAYSAFGVPFRLQQDLSNEANVASHGTSVPRLKFRLLFLLAYCAAWLEFGEVAGE
jgi:hypothetical protein